MSAPNPFQNIPAELRALKQWVNWDWENDKNDKPTKVPKQPNGRNASHSNSRTWNTFDAVSACARNGHFTGKIGFVFKKDGGYVGIDFDECRNPETGETERWARSEIANLNSYTEVSPSLTGWKVIVRGKAPGCNKKPRMEIYDQTRFFTMTGNVVPGVGRSTIEERDISSLHKRMMDGEFDNYPPSFPKPWKQEAPKKKPGRAAEKSESEEDWRLIDEVYKESHATTADALEKAFIEKHPDRYAERNDVKEDRAGKKYLRYSIEHFLEREADAEPFVPRLPITETSNADRLDARFGDDLRYCSDRRVWCKYDSHDGVWNVNDVGGVSRCMQEVCLDIYDEARQTKNEKLRKALAAWAFDSESRRRQENAIALARYHDGIEVRDFASVFDTHPLLLSVKNGTVDLRTGELSPHRREDFITKMLPVAYDPTANAPKFRKFLEETFTGDSKLIGYLMRCAGYMLTGLTSEQCFWIFYGPTASGKSTFVNILRGLSGDYGLALPQNFFLVDKSGSDFMTANLAGARLATCVESSEGRALDVARLKNMTGEDKISAALKHQNFFEFTPQVKLILATNHKPRIPATDDSIWRRVKLVPFNAIVPESERVPELAKKLLEEEGPGILAQAVLGCRAWLTDGLQEPETVRNAVKEYRTAEDLVRDFLDECYDRAAADGGTQDTRAAVYKKHAEWCREQGLRPLSKTKLTQELKRLGVTGDESRRYWYGLVEKGSLV